MEPRVTAIVVSFDTAAHVLPCLEALAAAAGDLPLEVLVVDPQAPDREASRATCARAPLPVERVELEANRGFGAAANAGAARARSPYIIFVNPDARPEPHALETLVRTLEAKPGAGAMGPRLVDVRGMHQTGDAGALPTAGAAWAHALGLSRLAGARGLFVAREARAREPVPVGWLSGAFLLVRAEAFRAVGGFDESFFLFGEDVDLGVRLGRAGFESWYAPAVVVRHEGGASYRRRGELSPLEGRWVVGLRRAHARTGAGAIARASFALALGVGLAARALGYAMGLGRTPASSVDERREQARRLRAAARAAFSRL